MSLSKHSTKSSFILGTCFSLTIDLLFLTREDNVLETETHIVRLLNFERINYWVIHLIDNNITDINSDRGQTKG